MPNSIPIAPVGLTDTQRRTLRALATLMIPASAAHGVPGADDPVIYADIERSLGRDARTVHEALAAFDALAGGSIEGLDVQAGLALVARLRRERPLLVNTVSNVIARCYYRDDRVMRAIGLEPRPPYPQGFAVEEGDWSLLEPVRRRAPMWRTTP